MLLGALGVYHRNVLNYATRAILPYDQRLSRFPAYLQQLDMESNGKSVTIDGKPVQGASGPVVWGEPAPMANMPSTSSSTRARASSRPSS